MLAQYATFKDEFEKSDEVTQAEVLQALLPAANPTAVRTAIDKAPASVKANVAGVFGTVPAKDRKQLYLNVIWILASLSTIALAGGMIAILRNAESAAFFAFAGLALGGLTGLLAPSPTSSGT